MAGYVRAGFRERDCNCLAESGRGARHQSDLAIESERIEDTHPARAFELELVIIIPLMIPVTTPIAAPSAMYRSKPEPDTRDSNPKHQPPNEPKILPMKPKPTSVPKENGRAVILSRSATGSILGTSR